MKKLISFGNEKEPSPKFSGGFTLIEVILTISILGMVVAPVMALFVLSAKANQAASKEYEGFLQAQSYIEEIKAMDPVDYTSFVFNSDNNSYEKTVEQTSDKFGARIKITLVNDLLLNIEVLVFDQEVILNSLRGSKIIE